MRYLVKNAEGQELTLPSLEDLHALYNQGFLDDGDLIRSERSTVWVKAGSMPALRGIRTKRQDPRKMLILLIASMLVVLGIVLLVKAF